MPLPVNIEDLLTARTIESDRIEFKAGWNPDNIYRSICAFANDFDNIGGGYILIGVEEENGKAKRPVKGLLPEQIACIQKAMIGMNNLIKPYYAPKLFIEEVDRKDIVLLWIPGGSERPYEIPEAVTSNHKSWKYFIRRYASSIEAKGTDLEELISLANQVPFDDRANTHATPDNISITLVRDHLRITQSRLHEFSETLSKVDLLGQMDLLSGPPEMFFPRNIALMLFSEKPEQFFPYSRIEVVEFPNGVDDPEFNERPPFTGPVQQQIIKAIDFLKTNILQEKIIKHPDRAEATHIWNYPVAALEEAIANAMYHRDYQVREPVEIRIYPDSIVVLNYGGPDRSIKSEAFKNGLVKPRRYRNRRLGDFLKELDLTEGKGTGIPRIKKALRENGSPDPFFDFDEDRTYFEVDFYIHPAFKEHSEVPKLPVNEDKTRLDTSDKIISLLRVNRQITIPEIAKSLNLSKRGVEDQLATLRNKGLISRKGSRKSGYWEVNDTI